MEFGLTVFIFVAFIIYSLATSSKNEKPKRQNPAPRNPFEDVDGADETPYHNESPVERTAPVKATVTKPTAHEKPKFTQTTDNTTSAFATKTNSAKKSATHTPNLQVVDDEANGVEIDFSEEEIKKAIIYSEILRRPEY